MKLTFVTVLAIALLPGYAISFLSNPTPGWTQLSSPVIAELPPLPGGTPTPPGQRTPGGTRGDCKQISQQTDKPLTALVPENGKGSTVAEHPVFWFYVPDVPEDIYSIEFSLHNKDEKTTLYRTSLQLTQTPGVIGIPLPPSTEHLKLNEIYHWRLIVDCVQEDTSEEDVLELDGWVTRVQQSSNPENPPDNIWYDALTNLAQRYLAEPQNPEVKKAWTELLQSVGLEGLAQEPLTKQGNNPM